MVSRLVHVINAALPICEQKIYVWSCTPSGSGWSALETHNDEEPA